MTQHHTGDKACRQDGKLDQIIIASRWLLYPINLGLIGALIAYVGKFLIEEYEIVMRAQHLDTEELLVGVLGLVDIAMVANLVVMIIQGGHQIFIRRLFVADQCSRPQWLDHIDSGILKVKMAMSIAGITMIRILKDFIDLEHVEWTVVQRRMIIHAMCLGSALVMALIWRLTHPTKPAAASGDAHI